MKRKSFLAKALLMLFAMLFSFTGARAQRDLTVYDGTEYNDKVPAYVFYFDDFTRSQYVIPADNLAEMVNNDITSITFYTTSNNIPYTTASEVVVYMAEVSYTTMTALEPTDACTTVYAGTLNAVTEGEGGVMTIALTKPFTYTGGNLLIGIENTTNVAYKHLYFYGTTVTGAAWAGSSSSSLSAVTGSVVNFIPKTTFTYQPSSGVIVEKPASLEATNITLDAATLVWTGGTGTYNVEYKKASSTEWTVAASGITDMTCTLKELEEDTQYQARVQSVSGSDVSGWTVTSFSTAYVVPFPFTEDFSGGEIPKHWELYSGLLEEILNGTATLEPATSGWTVGTANDVLNDDNLYANIYGPSSFSPLGSRKWIVTPAIPLGSNSHLAFDVAYCAYSGSAVAPQTTGEDDKFAVLVSTDGMATWTVLRLWDNAGSGYVLNDLTPDGELVIIDLDELAGQEVNVAFYVESTVANADNNLHIDNFAVEAKSACEKPTGLKVSYDGGTVATISWSSEEEAWDIEVNGEITEDVDNPAILTGLEYATVYTIRVRAKNNSGFSNWSSPITFHTDLSDDMCQIQLVLTDSYGDGWNGNAIKIVDVLSGIEIGTYANENLNGTSGTGENEVNTIYVSVPNKRTIEFQWVKGNYPGECSWVITDVNGEVITEGVGATSMAAGDVIATYNVDCTISSWRTPTDLTASEVGSRSVKLSWTENGEATAWVVAYKAAGEESFVEVKADANPYVLEGLEPSTAYTVKVRPDTDEAEKWSAEITFTTDVNFPAPKDMAASDVTAFAAQVTWTGEADKYNLRYGVDRSFRYDFETAEPFAVDAFSPCTTYDGDGLPTYGISGYTMPNSNYVGSVIAFADNDQWAAHSGNVMGAFLDAIPDTDAGVTANDDYFILPAITIEEGSTFSFWARSVSNQYGLERMKVGVYGGSGEISTYLEGSASTYTEVPITWTQYSYDLSSYVGQTIQLAINCVSSDAFALLIDDIALNIPVTEWGETITDITTTSYQLEGLTPETTYEVQVQAVFDENVSEWTSTTFTTLEKVPSPTGLAAEAYSRTAELSWTENGEATSWEICLNDDEENLIAADSNPFTLTGLTPETEYTAKVRAINGEDKSKWSIAATFTTDIAAPAPTDLAVEPAAKTAEVTWEGDPSVASFELQYAEATALWNQYDNGTYASGVGLGGGEFSWGVMFPAGTYSGNILSKVSVYDVTAMTGTVTIYNDDATNAPTDAIATKDVTLTGAGEFIEISFDNLELDATKNVWVIFYNASGENYPAAASVDVTGDPNGRWVELNGTWYDMADVGVTGSCFMVRAEIGTGKEPEWTTVANATSPAELTGLTPETTYLVKVKAIYDEGESAWTSTTFTTLEDNPVPSNIVADLVADGATITWDGKGDSYEVAYMALDQYEMFFYDDFDDYNLTDGLYYWNISANGETLYDYPGWLALDGAAFAFSWYDGVGAIAADNWLISPAVDLKGTLEFYAYAQYGDEYEVLLSTTGTEVEDFTTVLQPMAAAPASGDWVDIDLSSYEGQKGYIAIHHVFSDGFFLAIDNFGIYGDGHTDAGDIQFVETTDSYVTLSGLDTNKAYAYIIRSIKDGEASEWSEQNEFALLTLANDADNISLINNCNRMQAHVTLADRTFFQDNTWNTVCLPFDLTPDEVAASALAGADIRTLQGITVDGESTTLNFTTEGYFDGYGFWGGCPMIVKWDGTSNLEAPAFANVTITNKMYEFGYEDAVSGLGVTFKGTYAPMSFSEEVESILFIGEGNKINHPLAGAFIGSQHGYFEVEGLTSAGIKQFNTDLGDEDPTGIANVNVVDNSDWYDVSGRKLAGKPSMKGIYVNGGRKVTVK